MRTKAARGLLVFGNDDGLVLVNSRPSFVVDGQFQSTKYVFRRRKNGALEFSLVLRLLVLLGSTSTGTFDSSIVLSVLLDT